MGSHICGIQIHICICMASTMFLNACMFNACLVIFCFDWLIVFFIEVLKPTNLNVVIFIKCSSPWEVVCFMNELWWINLPSKLPPGKFLRIVDQRVLTMELVVVCSMTRGYYLSTKLAFVSTFFVLSGH